MKTGCMVMGLHKGSAGEKEQIQRSMDHLVSRGRKNVFNAFLDDDPFGIMASMYEREGIDTFVILPMCISEGKQSIWKMPASIHLPDNSGSWTMVGEHDVAIRFSTAMGRESSISEAILSDLGSPDDRAGVLILAYGSNLSQCVKTAEYYSDEIGKKGWKTAYGFTGIEEPGFHHSAEKLISEGCERLIVVPLFIAFDGKSAMRAKRSLERMNIDVEYLRPVSQYPEFQELLDSKIPAGW